MRPACAEELVDLLDCSALPGRVPASGVHGGLSTVECEAASEPT